MAGLAGVDAGAQDQLAGLGGVSACTAQERDLGGVEYGPTQIGEAAHAYANGLVRLEL